MIKRLRKLYYVPLEKYTSRYTLQLEDWTVTQFRALGATVVVVPGCSELNSINTGQVLDAFSRPIHAMKQIEWLLKEVRDFNISNEDFIFFEDMFHPGLESLAYVFSQLKYGGDSRRVPKIGLRCLAQTVDPDDFTHYTGMYKWMRKFEEMVINFVDCLFVASTEQMNFMKVAGWNIPIYVTGLPFNKQEVLNFAYNGNPWPDFDCRPYKVVFASRIAKEKQPNFLGALALVLSKVTDFKLEVAVLSGTKVDNYAKYHIFTEALQSGALQLYDDLSKAEYYKHLKSSRVMFNCSLQDWVSNTASEADTLGCNLVYPAYRSFPEAFDNNIEQLYIPWSLKDAVDRVFYALQNPQDNLGIFSSRQNETNAKTLAMIRNVVEGENCQNNGLSPMSNNWYMSHNIDKQLHEMIGE